MIGRTLKALTCAAIAALTAGCAADGAGLSTSSVAPPLATAKPAVAFVASAYDWKIPAWAPAPLEPEINPTTEAKVQLGRRLFYDGRLASDGMRSCASCHAQERAFTDTFPFSWGVTGERTARQTPSLANVGYASVLTWANPNMHLLEEQAAGPMFGTQPIEMGMLGQESELITRLSTEPLYRDLFAKAFPESGGAPSLPAVTKALSAFQRTLISVRSPYDRYKREGDANAISEAAKRGEALFFGPKLKCGQCHSGVHFTDATRGEGAARPFHNTGLYNVDGKGAYPPSNIGIAKVTRQAGDMGRFKTPSLRNIAVTAPYMHDGSLTTLEAVLDHYAAGGRTLVSGQANAGVGRDSPLKSPFMTGFDLSAQEKADVIAFLQSLTDETFLTDPRHSDPWKPSLAAR